MTLRPKKAYYIALGLSLTVCGALAGDMSCIGNQEQAAEWRQKQLPPEQQAQFEPVIDQLKQYAAASAVEMSAAEAPQQADVDALRDANPGANDETIGRLYQALLLQSAEADNHYAAMLLAQYHVHMFEAQMIAASSRIPSPADAKTIQDATDRYVAENGEGLSRLAQSGTFSRLLGIVAASSEASSAGRDIPATALARVGFDVPADDPVAAVAARLSDAAVIANSVGTAGTLRGDHLFADEIRNKDFRKAIMDHGGAASQEITRDFGGALNNQLLRNYVQKKIAQTIPPSPPPPDEAGQKIWVDTVVQHATDAAASIAVITKYAAPQVVGAMPGASASGAGPTDGSKP
ncbi:MAG TPA: hypothetical protein VII56_09785 [Rhizomicrobium sp.]